jgi:UDP-N-acetylglucosamine--N-acetylmuramyl-(pentapeptide) pyrophosphoryl-undecaprenol N-acetylglucosamine transferase
MTAPATFALAAGGTGGHLFPAEALAAALMARGHAVHLITDRRGGEYAKAFAPENIHVVPSETLRGRSLGAAFRMVRAIFFGVLKSRAILKRTGARALIAFGGYPSVPPGLAAASRGVPMMLHEQNAVMGRANRILARRARIVATGFETVAKLPDGTNQKVTGNPVRPAVIAARRAYDPPAADGPLRLLVFGGSQGAAVFSDVVPKAILALPEAFRARLRLVQQCRPEDLETVRATYRDANIDAKLEPFFSDMPARIAAAHLVLARAGASTVGELAVIGRPAILVPLPGAIDQDQRANASVLEKAGGALLVDQKTFDPAALAALLAEILPDGDRLAAMAGAAATLARTNAAERLADLAETLLANDRDAQQ